MERRRSWVFLATVALAAVACGDSTTPGGQGNDVINDTRDAEPRPPANPDPTDGSVSMGEPDASYVEGAAAYDAPGVTYPGITACSTCSCDPRADYCFGGATARKEPQLTPSSTTDAGLPVCPIVDAGAIGCTALPAACTDCACVAQTLQPAYACYLVCAFDGTQMNVYCPNP